MTVDVTRRGFLAGLLGTAVVVALPKNIALLEQPAVATPIDPFAIEAPPGWRYQWVRTALLGEPDLEDFFTRLKCGWTFVEPKLYPGAPVAKLENAIESSGLILMQKPEAEVRAGQLAELRAREARHGHPNRVIVETPHGFHFEEKKEVSPDDWNDGADADCQQQFPHESRREETG